MNEPWGGTEIDCLTCGGFSKFNRAACERAYVCQYRKTQINPKAEIFMYCSCATGSSRYA